MITSDELRLIALSLPEALERETWGESTFRAGEKIFVMLSTEGDRASVKASVEDQVALVAREPGTFSVAAYVGRFGWITVQLASVDPEEMRELIVDAWRRTAPKRLVTAYDRMTSAR